MTLLSLSYLHIMSYIHVILTSMCSLLHSQYNTIMKWCHNTAISKHEFLSEFWNCLLVICSHPLFYAIQALCDIFQCSLCIQRMWVAVFTNKFIWGTNFIQLHYWLRRTSGAIFFLEIRISMAADVGLWDSMTVMMQFLLLLGRCLCDLSV